MSSTSRAGAIACNTILPCLGIIVVGLRFHVRTSQKASFRIDDWLQIPVLLLFIGMAITALYGVNRHAFGYPTPPGPPTNPPESLILCEKLWFIIHILQIPALASIKIAALFFYRRIFVTSSKQRVLNWITWILIVIIIIWGMGFTGYYIGACDSHILAAWSGYLGFATYCLKTELFEQAYAVSDFMLDTMVLVIPLPSIWSLHMKLARKISITCVFMFALIGYGAAIARLVTFVRLANKSLDNHLPDIQTNNTQAVWFTALETGFAIFSLNLPSIWPLVSKVSVESVIRSVRSIASLGSRNSRDKSQTNLSITGRKEHLDSQTDDIELVPRVPGVQNATTADGAWHPTNSSYTHAEGGNVPGIHVQKIVEQRTPSRC